MSICFGFFWGGLHCYLMKFNSSIYLRGGDQLATKIINKPYRFKWLIEFLIIVDIFSISTLELEI